MVAAVPLELLASPLKNGRLPGDGTFRADHRGDGEDPHGGAVVFCKVVRRGGAGQAGRQVRAKAARCFTRRWAAGGTAGGEGRAGRLSRIAGNARLDGQFAKGERERLLAAAFMIR